MRKLLFITLGLMLLNFFTSCSDENSNIDEEKVQYVLQSKNSEVTKAAYLLLTPEEKYFIWNERIDYILSNENLTTEQFNFMNNLKLDLNHSIFIEDSTEEGQFIEDYPDENLSIFEPIQAYYYFSTLANMEDNGTWESMQGSGTQGVFFYSDLQLIADVGGGLSCHCHKGSIVSPGCQYGCTASTETKYGCGFLWLWSCNGRIMPWSL